MWIQHNTKSNKWQTPLDCTLWGCKRKQQRINVCGQTMGHDMIQKLTSNSPRYIELNTSCRCDKNTNNTYMLYHNRIKLLVFQIIFMLIFSFVFYFEMRRMGTSRTLIIAIILFENGLAFFCCLFFEIFPVAWGDSAICHLFLYGFIETFIERFHTTFGEVPNFC